MDNKGIQTIGIIWHCSYPWDVRLEKFINTLIKSYKVCLISKGKKDMPIFEKNNNLIIHRIICKGVLDGLFFRKIRGLLSLPVFFNPIWTFQCLSILKDNKVSIIIIRDLPLMWLGVLIGRFLKIPIIFDMAENYPAALIGYNNKYYKPFLIGNAFLAYCYEKIAIKLSKHIIVVTEEQKDRLIRMGISEKKISIILNTPVLEELNFSSPQENISQEKNILYTGKIDAHRGVETLIKALPGLIKEFPYVKLILAGQGTEVEKLKKISEQLGIKEHVIFLGWISHADVYDYIKKSTICLIPHLKSEHTDTTLPNKLFDYMAFGKPIISSDLVPVEKIIKKYNCGLIFKSGNYINLYEQIKKTLNNYHVMKFGENGKKAILERFNWSIDAANLQQTVLKSINS